MSQLKRVLAVLLMLAGIVMHPAHAAQYSYDQLGRLTGVIEADGSTISYTYDANGNLLSITRTGATLPLSISSFAPASGPVGTNVTIRGAGFNPAAAQNAVTIGGAPATVTAASPTTLVVNVPAGAVTGSVTVSTAGNNATASGVFTVTTVRITDFTPKIGSAGTSVAIDGEGFDQTAANNEVKFNGRSATVDSATTTQLSVTVPALATSGRIRVTSPAGSVESGPDFIVPPGTYTAARVGTAARIQALGPGVIYTASSTDKVALALFDGNTGERVSIVFSNVSMIGTWVLYAPDGTQVGSASLTSNSSVVDLAPLAMTGTYTLALRPTSIAGSATVRVVSDALAELLTNGTPVSMSLAPGQNALLSFNAVAGESYNFVMTNYVGTPATDAQGVSVLNPDGTELKNCGWLNGGSDCIFQAPSTGVHRLRLNQASVNATTFEARLNIDFRLTLTPGTPIDTELDRQGRHALLEFSVATGQVVTLNLSNIVSTPGGKNLRVTVRDNNGQQVSVLTSSSGNLTMNFPSLAAGAYTARVAPEESAMADFQIGFFAAQPIALASNGATLPFSADLSGQTGYFTFNGSQGQNLALGLTGLSYQSGASGNIAVQVLRPDGAQLTSATCTTSSGRCQLPLRNLPQNGTYRLNLTPSIPEKLNAGVTLSQSVTGALSLDTPFPVLLASPGQNAVLTFNQPSQRTIVITAGSLNLDPAGSSVVVRVFNASGTQVGNAATSPTSATVSLPNLAAGDYTVSVDPVSAATGSLQMILSQGTPLPLDGTESLFASAGPGEVAYYSFSGTAGQNVGIGLTNLFLSTASPHIATVRVYRPDNSQLTSLNCTKLVPGCTLALRNLPVGGTYRIQISGGSSQTMSFSIRASAVATTAVSLSASPVSVNFDVPGRFAEYSFVASAGNAATVRLGNFSITPAGSPIAMRVYDPSGTQVALVNLTSTPSTVNLNNVVEGTYTVSVVPVEAAVGTAEVTIASGLVGNKNVDGASSSHSTTVPGQYGYFTFNGTAGQSIGLGIVSYALTPASPTTFTVRVYRPDGVHLLSEVCNTSQTGCKLSLRSIPVSGTYRVQFEIGGQQTLSFSWSLSHAVGQALIPGATPVPVTLQAPGQFANYTFPATTGGRMIVRTDGLSMNPVNTQVMVRILNPSGSQVAYAHGSAGGPIHLANLVAGTYTVSIEPDYAATGSMQLTVADQITVAQAIDGNPVSYATSVPGEKPYISFTGTAGTHLGIGLTGVTLNPGSPSGFTVVVYKPNNTSLGSFGCSAAQHGCQLPLMNVPASGTYRIEVHPVATQVTSFALTISQSVTGNLAAGVPLPFSLSSPGQNAVITFDATAGQSFPLSLAAPAMTPTGSQVGIRVYRPNGTLAVDSGTTTSAWSANLNNLVDGTYTILLTAPYAATGSLQLSRP